MQYGDSSNHSFAFIGATCVNDGTIKIVTLLRCHATRSTFCIIDKNTKTNTGQHYIDLIGATNRSRFIIKKMPNNVTFLMK